MLFHSVMVFFKSILNFVLEQVCGHHFNKNGHTQDDMLPIIIEKVNPKNDEFLRLNREEHWIRTYQSVEHGENKYS